MSIEALNWAFALPLQDPKCKAVLLALANHVRRDGDGCYPSISRLALHSGCSERTVQRALTNLLQMKLVEVDRVPGRANYYRVTFIETPVENRAPQKTTPAKSKIHPRQILH